MPGIVESIRRLVSPEASARGAEDDVVNRAPEGIRARLRAFTQRRRQAEEDAASERAGNVYAQRRAAVREGERG